MLGADGHEDLGLVVDHVGCSTFLSRLKLEDRVERLPSRHWPLNLCVENVRAQCDALSPATRLVSERNESWYERLSSTCSRLSENQSKSSPACVSDASVRNDTIPESEIGFSGESQTPCDQETDEHDVIPNTRKRRRLLHTSPASALFSLDDFDENDPYRRSTP